MDIKRTIKKEIDLEEKIVLAVRSIVDQFFERPIPKKIILKNSKGFDIFKEFLQKELATQRYNIQVVDSGEEGYFIDVSDYLNQDNYPGKLM